MNSKLKYLFVFIFLFITMSFVSADLTDGLLGYWKFDETSGTIITDSLTINNGTNIGATINQTGIINKSYYYTTNDYATFNAPLPQSYTNYSVSLWFFINTDAPTTKLSLFTYDNSDATAGLMRITYTDGTLLVQPKGTTGTFTALTVSRNAWHHIVFGREGNVTWAYLDGTTMGADGTGNTYKSVDGLKKIVLGANRGPDSEYLKGRIDELGIWNRRLTSAEVTQLYNSGAGNSYPFTLTNSTIINPQPILYTNNAYNFLGTFFDSDYNSETTYEYSFGYNNTNSFNGSEIYIDTNQNLDYAQTESKDFNLNKTFDNTDVDENLYSFFTVHKYINGVYDKSITGWSSTTFDIVQAEIILNIYDENTLLPISTARITDSNGTTYDTNATGYINLGQLSGNKSFTISKTGYDSRKLDFFFKVSDYYNWNFALTQAGNSESIDFIVKDSNDNLWTNKYLQFNKLWDNHLVTANIPSARNNNTAFKFNTKLTNITMLEIQICGACTASNQQLLIRNSNDTTTICTSNETLNITPGGTTKKFTFNNCNLNKLTTYLVKLSSATNFCIYSSNNLTYPTNGFIEKTGDASPYVLASYDSTKLAYLKFNTGFTTIINSILTSSSGTATASLLPAGDYNALLYDATGTLVDTYEKTTVTVNKPKNEKTSALISPYDIYVSGLLQYNLTNKSESSVTFNVFAGTTGFYTFTAVDYNATTADQKYIPKSYFVQVPMGNDYESAVSYTPYLLLKTDGIVPKVVVLDQLNRTIENAQIYVSKYIGGVLTIVESGNTFSNGAFNFSAYPLDVYYLTVYYNGTDYGTFSVQPRESSDIFYIKIDRTTAEDVAQKLLIQTNLDDTSRYQNRDTNINVLGTITSNFNYITDYNVNVYERGNLVYSVNTVATGLSIDINKFVDVNLIPDYVHSAVIKVIVNYSIAGVTGSQTFSKNIIVTDNTDVLATVSSAVTEIGQPLSMFIALAVAIMLMAVLIFFGILTDPAILAVFGALVVGVFMMLGFLDIGVVVLGMDIGRFAYFLGLMATLYFALFGGR